MNECNIYVTKCANQCKNRILLFFFLLWLESKYIYSGKILNTTDNG